MKIVVLPGDGIGPEVTTEAVKVLQAIVGNQAPLDLTRGCDRSGGHRTKRVTRCRRRRLKLRARPRLSCSEPPAFLATRSIE